MRLSIAALALCLAASAQAFKNTSPFFLLSTTKNLAPQDEVKQLQTNDDILQTALKTLSFCPSKKYILVSQENVNIEDFTGPRAVPFLKKAMKSELIGSVLSVEEVVDQSMADSIQQYLQKHCEASLEIYEGSDRVSVLENNSLAPVITRVNFKALPSSKSERSALLGDYDHFLRTIIDTFQDRSSYTIIYTSTPISAETQIIYEPTFQEPLNVELKRRTDLITTRASNGNKTVDPRPLFEKYQFLTPGIFMAILTVIILLSILSVGIAAIAGLEVSYGAFDKEMGPAAGKK